MSLEVYLLQKTNPRQQILGLERLLTTHPRAILGDNTLCPLKHSFAPGIYVREIFIPKGTILTGKIHKHEHPNFLMSGKVEVYTENGGLEILQAPLAMISKAGTKRVIYAMEDTVWITVHATDEQELEKIEVMKARDTTVETGDNTASVNKDSEGKLPVMWK